MAIESQCVGDWRIGTRPGRDTPPPATPKEETVDMGGDRIADAGVCSAQLSYLSHCDEKLDP